jgi:hypothetical protein
MRARSDQLGATLGVCDRHRDQLGEIRRACLRLRWEGLLGGRTRDDDTPEATVDPEGRSYRRTRAGLGHEDADRARGIDESSKTRRTARSEDSRREVVAAPVANSSPSVPDTATNVSMSSGSYRHSRANWTGSTCTTC